MAAMGRQTNTLALNAAPGLPGCDVEHGNRLTQAAPGARPAQARAGAAQAGELRVLGGEAGRDAAKCRRLRPLDNMCYHT